MFEPPSHTSLPKGPRLTRSGGRRGMPMWLKILAGLTTLGFTGAIAFVIVAWIYVIRVTDGLPGIEDLAQYEPPVMTRVHAGDGRLIAEYARESRVFVPIETIPANVKNAFISAEDKNFYEHDGVDPVGMIRGGLRSLPNLLSGEGSLQSGSTITQQVAKNFKLSAEQKVARKVREIVIAKRLEKAFTKDEILELYLNEIYLGRRAYGVAAASLLYFGKSLDELTLAEAAYLAALPKGPNNYHPTLNKARAIERRNYVIGRMEANNFVTAAEASDAAKDDLVVADRLTGATYEAAEYFTEEVRRLAFSIYGEDELYDGGLSIRTTLDTKLQIAAREALRDGLEDYDRRYGYRGPVTVIDPESGWDERLAEVETDAGVPGQWSPAVVLGFDDAVARIGLIDGSMAQIPLAELVWARRVAEDGSLGAAIVGPKDAVRRGEVIYVEPLGPDPETGASREGQYGLRQIPAINGALMAINPHTGRVMALVGGYSYRRSQFNRATQAKRQPGSTFKPFVYAAAFDSGLTPVDKILDAPYVSPNADKPGFYKPQNYTGRWYGESTLRLGVEQSRNAMTVRLANKIGLERVSATAERLGVYDDLPAYEAMALGAGETTLWRLLVGYTTFVNGGKRIEPTILDRVQGRDGKTVYMHDQRECEGCDVEEWTADTPEPVLKDPRPQVLDPVTAYQIVSLLEGVVQRGTATRVKAVGKPIAGKTGTTNDFKDAWFVGFSPDLIAGVYIGFDTPKSLGEGEAGGRVAAPVFRDFMIEALKDEPAISFRIPEGVRLVKVEPRSGQLARLGDPNYIYEAFRPGTEPTTYAASGGATDAFDAASDGIRIATPYENVNAPDASSGSPALRGDDGSVTAGNAELDAILSQAAEAGRNPGAATPPAEAGAAGAADADAAEAETDDSGTSGIY